jgi:hypothetical protein
MPLSEVLISLSRFSRKSQPLCSFFWKHPIANFTQIGREMWEVLYKVSRAAPSATCLWHRVGFHEN